MASWRTRPAVRDNARRQGNGALGDTGRARPWGLVCRESALYPGPQQNHEPLDLSADMSLARENAHVGPGQAVEAGKLKTGEGPSQSHCAGPVGQESLNWAGPGAPGPESAQGSQVQLSQSI